MKSMLTHRACGILLITILISSIGYSQKNIDHQSQLWMRYQLKLKINNHWSASQQLEERTYWIPWRQYQFLSHTMAHYQLSKGWNLGAGLTYYRQALPQDAHKEVSFTQPGFRPQLEIGYKNQLFQKFNMNQRFGTALRYFKPENGNLQFGNYRISYKLELQYQPVQKLNLKAYEEVFVNFGKNIVNNTFDQNRFGGSIQYMAMKKLGFELGYINSYQKRASGTDFYERNIVRFTIHHALDWSSKTSKSPS
ncbi:MAG: DUF2490 domain-containing protein [Aquaticitalea sp.]